MSIQTDPRTADQIALLVEVTRTSFESGKTRPLLWRRKQLDAMERMLRENTQQLSAALKSDLGKAPTESWLTEIGFTLSDIGHQRSHMRRWSQPRRASVPLAFQPARAKVIPEPKGVVLILAPWNYPVQLLLSPMAAAIAAGNAVVAKPSEVAPATAALLTRLCGKYLDRECIRVIEGAVDTATSLLEQRFDHILFTGGTRVGKIVMRAAAEHLTPVTLELGGKSPAIVASDADIEVAGRRIAWGKYVNSGQTCIAPDYVLVEKGRRDALVSSIRKAIKEFYGGDPQKSPDYGRIINQDHFGRLEKLMSGTDAGQIAVGGTTDQADRYIAPTVLVNSDPASAIMQEEIFGPLLPVIEVDSVQDAIEFVNHRPKPLALYIFSNNDDVVDRVLDNTSSGGVNVNGTLLHITPPDLPFGGVGPSGMGAYHGQTGFDTFSHLKSVLDKFVKPDLKIAYPPYSRIKTRIIKLVQ